MLSHPHGVWNIGFYLISSKSLFDNVLVAEKKPISFENEVHDGSRLVSVWWNTWPRFFFFFLAIKLCRLDQHEIGYNRYHRQNIHYYFKKNSIIQFHKHINQLLTCSNWHLNSSLLRFKLKGTNGRQKTHEIFHGNCIFYSGFMCQTTVIFGITKDGSLAFIL